MPAQDDDDEHQEEEGQDVPAQHRNSGSGHLTPPPEASHAAGYGVNDATE